MNTENITLGYIFNLFLFFLPGIVTYVVKNSRYYNFFPNIKVKEVAIESIFYTFINYYILRFISMFKVENQNIRVALIIIIIILTGFVMFQMFLVRKKMNRETSKLLDTIAMLTYFLFYILYGEKFDFKSTLGLIDISRNYQFNSLHIITSQLQIPVLLGVILRIKDFRIPNFFPYRWLRTKKITKCEITDKNTGKSYIGFLYQIVFEENVRITIVTEEEEEIFLELKASDLIIKDLCKDKYI